MSQHVPSFYSFFLLPLFSFFNSSLLVLFLFFFLLHFDCKYISTSHLILLTFFILFLHHLLTFSFSSHSLLPLLLLDLFLSFFCHSLSFLFYVFFSSISIFFCKMSLSKIAMLFFPLILAHLYSLKFLNLLHDTVIIIIIKQRLT